MDKAARRQSRLDIERLRMAADRLDTLSEAYMLAMSDLEIARQGLKSVAVWAENHESFESIHDRAMDTLHLMYHK